MTDQHVFEQTREIFQDLFEIPGDQVTRETSPETLEKWDSLQHLNVVLALEQTFSIELLPEEIEQMRSVGSIVEILLRKMDRSHGS